MPPPPTLPHNPLASPPHSREDLATWLATTLGISFPPPSCPHHHSPLDYLAHTFLESDDPADAAVWACRGGGKTFLGALATLLDLLFKPGIQIRILGGSLEQSDKMYTYLKTFFHHPQLAPALSRPPTRRRLQLLNGSVAEILAQSDRSVRGTRIQKLRCDEVELFHPDVWAAAQLTTRSIPQNLPTTPADPSDPADPADPSTPIAPPDPILPPPPAIRGAIEALSTMHIPNGLMQKLLSEPAKNPPPTNAPPPENTPLTTPSPCHPLTLSPCQPPSPSRKIFTWCLWDVISKCHGNRKCASCPLWSDCQGRAKSAKGFLHVADAISMHARVSRSTWEHEMLCHPPVLQNAVFPSFRRSIHVQPWPLNRQAEIAERISLPDRSFSAEKLIAGIDFGFSGAFVCLWIQTLRDQSGRRVAWVLDELLTQQRTLHSNISTMKSRSPITSDPIRDATIRDATLRDATVRERFSPSATLKVPRP